MRTYIGITNMSQKICTSHTHHIWTCNEMGKL